MNIFITGGTGLIGSAFINQRLMDNPNDKLWVLTRDANQAKRNLPDEVHIEEDIAKINFADFDVVLNLAGEPIVSRRWSESQKNSLCESRWKLTEQIANKIDKEVDPQKPIRFISGSAVGIYGRQPTGIITEAHYHYFPEFSHNLCQHWEDLASRAKHANVALLRTGIVLSPNGGALEKMLLPFKLGLGGKIASGEQYMPWIHIDDMIAGIEYLIDHPVMTGPFNFTAPNPVNNKTFSKTLASVLNRPCLFPVPEFVLRILMGEMADLVVYGQNAVPHNLQEAGFEFKFKELRPALNDVLKVS